MLGELYRPAGPALETACVVLEAKCPCACNIALNCTNGCTYCYVSKVTKSKVFRLPKTAPVQLVKEQVRNGKGFRPEGVFLSFLTDPFLPANVDNTEELIEYLKFDIHEDVWFNEDVKIATLSKIRLSMFSGVRHGVSIVSFDREFWRQYEPNTTDPLMRLQLLRDRGFVWVSMEPYPPSTIYKQDFKAFLTHFEDHHVNLIIFGKWNYNARAKTEEARIEYAENIDVLTDFCKSNNIRLHVKTDTMKFAFPNKE